MIIPFNKPYLTGNELKYIAESNERGQLSGDGHFTKLCNEWIETNTGCLKALLTHSCTAALEMAAILLDIKEGDEVIMPSYTFVSTANPFVLRGAIPVFVDVRSDTLNIDENLIEHAITPKTKAIVVVHYAGISCEMDVIMDIAQRYNLVVVEDAAQGIMSKYKGRPLGSIGHIGCFSFHETKNIISGEGGAVLINDKRFVQRAEIIREKGTNRSLFFRGQVDKYTWVDLGSSYLPGEIIAAFLWAQMEKSHDITNERLAIWNDYHNSLYDLELKGLIIRPTVPEECTNNAHMYYILLKNLSVRTEFIEKMSKAGVKCVFHYIPLHNSPFGILNSRTDNQLINTIELSDRLVRLPLWVGLREELPSVIKSIHSILLESN